MGTTAVIVGNATPVYRTVVTGVGQILKLAGPDTVKLLMDFKDSRSTRFERRPSTNFAGAFIKAYEQANGVKKN
jgi:hypothetical protein